MKDSASTSDAKRAGLTLTVDATVEGADGERPKMAAYAFTSAGALLGQAPLDERGTATIALDERVAADEPLRVLVGPDLSAHAKEHRVTYDELQRYDAVERRVRVQARVGATLRLTIGDALWRCWFPHVCRVRGRVVKRIHVQGHAVDQVICHGTVRIYEVDAFNRLVVKLPYDILDRIRWELLEPPRLPHIPNRPDPPPFEIDPGWIDPRPIERIFDRAAGGDRQAPSTRGFALDAPLGTVAESSARTSATLASHEGHSHGDAPAAVPETRPIVAAMRAPATLGARATGPLVDAALAAQLRTANEATLRSLILANAALITPYLCLWPWWIYYTKQLVATVTLDADGRFDAWLFLGCGPWADQPDLYFTVEQEIGGTGVLVYHPPVPCNTHWNYACGTEVLIVVTDPRAIPCADNPLLPDGGVTILAVGRRSLVDIYGSGATPVTPANKGLLHTDLSTSYTNAPFGGQIGLVVDFGSSLRYRDPSNPAAPPNYYYRWSYRQLDPATLAPTTGWSHLTTPVAWHYRLVVGSTVMYPTKQFGPVAIGTQANLFEVPRLVSPDGDPAHYWIELNEVVDRPCAYFDTRLAPAGVAVPLPLAGKVELMLELFNATGAKINPSTAGVGFRIPRVGEASSSTFVGVVHTDPAGPANLTPAGDFVFTVHFDNNPTHAVSDPPTLSSGAVTDPCGFLRYAPGDVLTFTYHPTHPNGHAVYAFSLVRGAPPPTHSEGGEVGTSGTFTMTWGPTGWDGAPVSPAHTPTVAELLQTCTEAAFNANLAVYGKATNGWGRIGYDDFFPRAFALARRS